MIYKIAAGIMLLFGGVTMVCVGITYAGYALYWALLPYTGPAAAAGIAAGTFLFLPLLGWAFVAIKGRRRRQPALLKNVPPSSPENLAVAFLSGLAREKPLMGVALAGVVGAATAFLRRKRK